jgi:hypothetical protein
MGFEPPGRPPEAAQALRGLIEHIVLRLGAKRGQIERSASWELGTILSWTATRDTTEKAQTKTPAAYATGVSDLGCGDPERTSPQT